MKKPISTLKAPRWCKIFIICAAPPTVSLLVFAGLIPFLEDEPIGLFRTISLILLSIGLNSLFVITFLSIFKQRIEIYENKIRKIDIFKTKELYNHEIKGFRLQGIYVVFIPRVSNRNNLKIGNSMENMDVFMSWASENFENLDETDIKAEENAILQSADYGHNKVERTWKLENARRWSRFLTNLSFGVTFWGIMYPKPYNVAIVVLGCLPLLSLASILYFSGIIRLDDKEQSAHPNVIYSFIGPPLALAIRACIDWNILFVNEIWFPVIAVWFVSTFCFFMLAKKLRSKILKNLIILPYIFVYSYGVVLSANGLLDNAKPMSYQATILSKSTSSGRHTSFYFKVSPWGQKIHENEIKVSRSLYNKSKAGDIVTVKVKQGKLQIPYYIVG